MLKPIEPLPIACIVVFDAVWPLAVPLIPVVDPIDIGPVVVCLGGGTYFTLYPVLSHGPSTVAYAFVVSSLPKLPYLVVEPPTYLISLYGSKLSVEVSIDAPNAAALTYNDGL